MFITPPPEIRRPGEATERRSARAFGVAFLGKFIAVQRDTIAVMWDPIVVSWERIAVMWDCLARWWDWLDVSRNPE